MTPPRSVTAAAGLAGLTAALTALLWTTMDSPSTTMTVPPPAAPDGVTQEEWERALTSPSPSPDPDPDPMTYFDLLALLYDGRLVALALTGIVLWLVVAVAAARGLGWARFVALAGVAGQSWMLVSAGAASPPAAYVVGAVIVAGAMSAALLFRPESIAYVGTTSEPRSTTPLVS